MNKTLLSIFITLICYSCVCNESFEIDTKKEGDLRYKMLEEKDFAIQFEHNNENYIDLGIFTSDMNCFIKNRGVKCNITQIEMVLVNTNDTLKEIPDTNINDDDYILYSCKNFKEVIEKNKNLRVKVKWEIDSAQIINKYENTYLLTKQKNCHLSIRVH